LEAAIAKYLSARLDGGPEVTVSNLSRIPGGASRETWMFDAAWNLNGSAPASGAFVLRKDPPASLVESDREVEYAFYSAFDGTDVPVPRMRWLEQDTSHLGAPFFIMDRILDCEASTRRILEPDYAEAMPMLGRRMYEILGAIHRFRWQDSPVAAVVPSPPARDECWSREVDYWEDMINRHEISPQPIARAAIRWLRANPPPPAHHVSVVHGDYRVGNFLYTKRGIHGIVDWEMAHLGDPLEDLAWSFMEVWEARNGKKGGIIDAEDAIRIYEDAAGFKVDRDALHWWDLFSGLKGQGIWITGTDSYQKGQTSELILPMTSYWLHNFQDEVLLRSMGRGA
jgi:aminoglycoside phosphotransferase (APT) family kinase protein